VHIPVGTKTTTKILLSPEELASTLGISVRTIYNRLSRKSKDKFYIPHIRVGRLVKFHVDDVDEYLRNNRQI
jgi:excisionase family DNA binding protein